MTKRELVARLTREPIVVQQIAKLAHYRVALHSDPDPRSGIWLGLAQVGGALLVEDDTAVEAHIDGKIVRLTHRETEAIVSRLRTLFRRGEFPAHATLPPRRRATGRAASSRAKTSTQKERWS